MARNYPNPFNPKTTIRFDLPLAQNVSLVVFDISGRKITTLVDEALDAGYHSVDWSGRDEEGIEMASGVYFYKIKAGPLKRTERMVLLK
jgi:flagellar hook assembly protein FlgD